MLRKPSFLVLPALVLQFFLAALLLTGCAGGPPRAALVEHGFSPDGWADGWAEQVDLLEYRYGNQYRMTQRKVEPGQKTLGYGINIYGDIPRGDFLFVRWRIKATGEEVQEQVDLRQRMPADIKGHRLTFVIDGRQLYVYLVTPQGKKTGAPPVLRTTWSKYYVTYEIYPQSTYPR